MTKAVIVSFLKQYLFWILFFILGRTIFILGNINELSGTGISEILLTYWYAIYLDISTACYIMSVSFVFLFLSSLFWQKLFGILNLYYTYLVVLVMSVIIAGELGIYDEWGTKLNYKAITYLLHPDEIIKTAKVSVIITGILVIIIQCFAGFYFYRKFVYLKRPEHNKRNYVFSFLFLIIIPPVLLLGIRGGIQQIPVKQSDVYFSKNHFLNIAAVNSGWNLIHSIYKNKKYMNENPYRYYDLEEAKKVVANLYTVEKDTTIKILTVKKPNIVFIILESWAADVVPACGGDSGITPRFDNLVNEGLVFTNIYGSGARSDQGIPAILSGYPAQPTTSIIEQPNKGVKLPCISIPLKKENYFTSFHFGGQLNYGNIKGYLYDHGFDFLFEEKDFSSSLPKGRLGYHDEYLFEQFLKDINNTKEPFMAVAFTLSSHSPYDQPMPEVLHWGDDERDYINSVYYTDSCLGVFFQEAQKQWWYNNTLFVIVADHSHSTPRHTSFVSPEYKKIPMLFYGNVLKEKYKSYRYEYICSQTDIVATILAQLEIPYEDFKWSKNLFNPTTKQFAYYAFKDGVGWVTENSSFAYSHEDRRFYISNFNSASTKDSIIKDGKSYLQVLFEEYLDY